jgi:hypothetical protein
VLGRHMQASTGRCGGLGPSHVMRIWGRGSTPPRGREYGQVKLEDDKHGCILSLLDSLGGGIGAPLADAALAQIVAGTGLSRGRLSTLSIPTKPSLNLMLVPKDKSASS